MEKAHAEVRRCRIAGGSAGWGWYPVFLADIVVIGVTVVYLPGPRRGVGGPGTY